MTSERPRKNQLVKSSIMFLPQYLYYCRTYVFSDSGWIRTTGPLSGPLPQQGSTISLSDTLPKNDGYWNFRHPNSFLFQLLLEFCIYLPTRLSGPLWLHHADSECSVLVTLQLLRIFSPLLLLSQLTEQNKAAMQAPPRKSFVQPILFYILNPNRVFEITNLAC